MEKIEKRLGIICPGTTTFHVCADKPSRFVGCCAVDACGTSDGNCPQESLDSTSFHRLSYLDVPGQACVDKKATGGLWYTCAAIQPPFMGCCAVDPCKTGACPAASLRAAALSDNKTAAAIFLGENLSSSSSSALSSATASASSTPQGDAGGQNPPGLSKGAVAGISASVAVAAILLATLLVIWLRRRFEVKRKQRQQQQQHPPAVNGKAGGGESSTYSPQHDLSPNMQSTISPYTSPSTLANSPYTDYQPSPPQQWSSYQPSTLRHDARHQSGASAMTAELPAVASDGTRKAHDETTRASKLESGPAELDSERPARRSLPVELEDPSTYDRGPRPRPQAQGGPR